jgi:signal transduction histidine kinase
VHDIQQNILCIEQFNLKEFISDILKGFDQDVLARVRVLCDFAPELMVASDKNLLKIIALNLLENGFTFSSNSGAEITIKAYTTPSSDLVIKVMDNGPGIPDTLKERIFDMFYQGSTKSTGTGLGLYMVRKAARKLGGDVILSKENGLTTFVVKLPQSDILSPEQQGSTNQSAISAA